MAEMQFCRCCMKSQQVTKEVAKYEDQIEEVWKCAVCGNIVRTSRVRDLFKKLEDDMKKLEGTKSKGWYEKLKEERNENK